MNTLSKTFLYLSSLCLLASATYAKPVEVVQPKVVGLYFHASWCAACAMLDPEMQAASEELKKSPFLLVTLDVSNKLTQYKAGMTASAMGFADIYANTGVKTGFVILIDTKTGEEVDRITKNDDATTIANKIKALTNA